MSHVKQQWYQSELWRREDGTADHAVPHTGNGISYHLYRTEDRCPDP